MIMHILKMVWNRKRVNGLIIVEIFVSFLVLAVVLTATAYYIDNYRRTVGYTIDDVWKISVNTRLPGKNFEKIRAGGLHQLEIAMKDMPEIESVGWMGASPYAHSTSIHGVRRNGAEVNIEVNRATDDIQNVLKIPLVAGRWFTKDDDASRLTPVVINEKYARLMFGDGEAVGKLALDSTCQIVGVVTDFRKAGEFSGTVNYQIARFRMLDTTENHWGSFLIRVKAGTAASFQGKLSTVLESVQKGWSFDIETLSRLRESDFRLRLAPLIAGGIIAVFLLLMVALGLIGVLWQNVSQRTKELGLRRALGGTASRISLQIRGEQFVITTIGVAAGAFLVSQFPLLNLIDFIDPGIYAGSLVVSLLLMYGLTYLCSLFPSWLAMEVQPAEALHYE